MDNNLLFAKLKIKSGKKYLNQNLNVGFRVSEEQMLALKELLEKITLPKDTEELKKLVPKIENISTLLTNLSSASYLDQSSGFMNSNKYKIFKELLLKCELKYSNLLQEIGANIEQFNLTGMSRFIKQMKYDHKYYSKNPNTRKTLIHISEALDKAKEVYHHIETEVDYGEFQGKKVTKFDLMPLLQNKDAKIRRDAYRHFKKKKTAAIESLYILLSSMARTKNEMVKIQGYEDCQDSKCKNDLFLEKKLIYDLYKLIKKNVKLKNRLHEVRRKLINLPNLGAQDFFVPIFDDKKITLKEGEELLNKFLVEPLNKEWPKYKEVYEKITLDVSDKSDEKRRSGAWCEALNNGEEDSAIIYFGKYNNDLLSVRTIAHEKNHGVHFHMQLKQGHEINDTGTPGYFFEAMAMSAENRLLTNMINNELNKDFKTELLLGKLEDSFGAIFGQTMAHFIELGFYDGTINSFKEFKEYEKKLIKDFSNPKIENHEDIENNLILRVHHFDYTLYCINYVIAELMAAKLEIMPFTKVVKLAEELPLQVGKEEVSKCFKKHGIDISNLEWVKEVFKKYEERLNELERLIKK